MLPATSVLRNITPAFAAALAVGVCDAETTRAVSRPSPVIGRESYWKWSSGSQMLLPPPATV
jgi:hypothetical protein